jgi:hypothetical protein
LQKITLRQRRKERLERAFFGAFLPGRKPRRALPMVVFVPAAQPSQSV